jgi:hypothetical protein
VVLKNACLVGITPERSLKATVTKADIQRNTAINPFK